jgi:hypothetical protein
MSFLLSDFRIFVLEIESASLKVQKQIGGGLIWQPAVQRVPASAQAKPVARQNKRAAHHIRAALVL